ncbi:MAG: glycosyltransferase family 4 protein [Lachnospiraceae bacterium]|nr:glycosyltransferase family 4 protein [Lachnospiraceae bacterium]
MGKRILFITHQLSKTGAPIVLLDLICFCRSKGNEILVMSMAEGELQKDLENMGVPVLLREHFLGDYPIFLKQAEEFDLVVANTLIAFEAIHVLKYSKVPVIWWLHEGRQYFEYFAKVLPDFYGLPPHIHVYAVSGYVQDALQDLYGYRAPLLPIGMEDRYVPEKTRQEGLLKFVVSGTYSKLKGQDILAEAIRQLPSDWRDKFQLEFYGDLKVRDEEVYVSVQELAKQYQNVSIMPFISHEKMLTKIAQADCMIIPSRVDPLPTVAVEAMMLHIPCICSHVCGVARQLQDGKDSLLFESENAKDLAEKIQYVLEHSSMLPQLGKAAREVYETYYAYQIFEKNVDDIFGLCII